MSHRSAEQQHRSLRADSLGETRPVRLPEPNGRLPRDARQGLMRAWLAILSERHPNVVWMPTPVERPGADGDKRW
jgi:hypothetical protein